MCRVKISFSLVFSTVSLALQQGQYVNTGMKGIVGLSAKSIAGDVA
jgi:hypothetical protein